MYGKKKHLVLEERFAITFVIKLSIKVIYNHLFSPVTHAKQHFAFQEVKSGASLFLPSRPKTADNPYGTKENVALGYTLSSSAVNLIYFL